MRITAQRHGHGQHQAIVDPALDAAGTEEHIVALLLHRERLAVLDAGALQRQIPVDRFLPGSAVTDGERCLPALGTVPVIDGAAVKTQAAVAHLLAQAHIEAALLARILVDILAAAAEIAHIDGVGQVEVAVGGKAVSAEGEIGARFRDILVVGDAVALSGQVGIARHAGARSAGVEREGADRGADGGAALGLGIALRHGSAAV